LFSVATVRTIRGGESGGKDNRLCAAATAALLTATDDEWSHLGICRTNQRGDAERSADLRRANNKMRRSGRLGIKGMVVGSLYRINYECAAA
jgi:hypothetical protein